jgi:hypothetical protein
MEEHISLDDLRRCWSPLSPWFFVEKMVENPRPHLLITARYDLTFLPHLAQLIIDRYRSLGAPCSHIELPCGHYTTARFPFSYLDAWHICRFLRKHLPAD